MNITEPMSISPLQQSYRQFIAPYAKHVTHAITLTLKLRATVRINENYKYSAALDEDKINSTLRRFTARLTALLYGNHAKHRNKQAWAKPLVIAAVEGLRHQHKRPHVHIALGNVPADRLSRINEIITQAWLDCDFGYQEMKIKPLQDEYGWVNYITKEVGYANNDALNIVSSTIPQFINSRI